VPAGQDLADYIAEWNSRTGIPTGLRAMGVTEAMLPSIADAALKDHCHATNARRATREDYLSMLTVSMG